ncbi:MAG: Ig-like domain-containing protein [Flavobacteriales bacterium]|nr:Ig-like domain-containing protein [Flavobacteriales bacterium]MCB9363761.1 Ig-like domain-containing protein [Flavobacteriales bacterium]
MPPAVKETIPENQSINFIEKTITVEFNEFISLTNLTSQLIVSPLMEETPDITAKGKKLVIKLKGELKPNTTYSLNFGDAIADITEGNTYPNYKYVFSTGSFIDSLNYEGNVIGAFDLMPKENVFVMLYDEFEDSIPKTKKPRYIAKTDKNGQFQITNISKGVYKLFALTDINSNYLFDLPNEEIGFYNELIQIDSSLTDNKIYLFTENTDLQYVTKSANPAYGKIEIDFNLPADSITVASLNPTIKLDIEEVAEDKKKKVFWLANPALEEKLDLVVYNNSTVIDTVEIELIKSDLFLDSTLAVTTNVGTKLDLNTNIQFTAVRPIAEIDTTKISLLMDSVKVDFKLIQDSINIRKYNLIYPFKEKTDYVLLAEPSAFTDIYNLQNDTILKSFKTKRESDYGNLKLNITPPFAEKYIVYLILKDKVIATRYGSKGASFTFNYLAAGDYNVKLIVDNNNNGVWDTGIYDEKLQPEKVIYYEGKISIQENWDNKIDWIIE